MDNAKDSGKTMKKRFVVALLCLAHISFFILFLNKGYKTLFTYNLFSSILYSLLAFFYNEDREFFILAIVAVEIPVYSVITTLFLGNYSGSIFFPFGMLTAVFLFAVNRENFVYRYILLSLPSVLSAFFIALWERIPFLGSNLYAMPWFMWHRLSILAMVIAALLYLCISGNMELVKTQRKNDLLIKQLEFISNHDVLTGIPNRRYLLHKVKTLNEYVVAIFDVDDFKKINDTYGHEIGDRILCRMVKRVLSVLLKDTYFARWGGEEFLIVFPNKSIPVVQDIMERVVNIVSENIFAFDKHSVAVSITAGVADSNEAESFEDAINKADARLYYGKQHGKNRVVFTD